jgi:hypothetical protein
VVYRRTKRERREASWLEGNSLAVALMFSYMSSSHPLHRTVGPTWQVTLVRSESFASCLLGWLLLK